MMKEKLIPELGQEAKGNESLIWRGCAGDIGVMDELMWRASQGPYYSLYPLVINGLKRMRLLHTLALTNCLASKLVKSRWV